MYTVTLCKHKNDKNTLANMAFLSTLDDQLPELPFGQKWRRYFFSLKQLRSHSTKEWRSK
jgi:hypothetical protein